MVSIEIKLSYISARNIEGFLLLCILASFARNFLSILFLCFLDDRNSEWGEMKTKCNFIVFFIVLNHVCACATVEGVPVSICSHRGQRHQVT